MAAAFLERLAGSSIDVSSAGTQPTEEIHPAVVQVMRERGIDLTAQRPRRLEQAFVQGAHVVVTMGCGDECPFVPGKRYEDWDLPDPAGRPLDEVRAIRDDIERRVRDLMQSLDR